MAEANLTPRWGKLIVALMSADPDVTQATEARLTLEYGAIEAESACFPFSQTNYYTPEMGAGLQKKFISFVEMIELDALVEIKHCTNALEQEFAHEGKRRINIDPGYVVHGQMILATTKDFTHRIYLGKGIYAELTYLCRSKKFYPFEWTYPDYREPLAIEFFEQVRSRYLQQIRTMTHPNLTK